jgi:hypothetical protein
MITRTRLLFAFVIVLAAVLTFLKVPTASSQGVTLVVAEVTGNLPLTDPDSPMWQKARALEVPLSAQIVAKPMLMETRTRSVSVRALHNREKVAILVEWADNTKNDSMVRVQDFRDAVAVQFPIFGGQPFFCMGQQGSNVNIWHWKADWQADIDQRQDMEALYPNMYVDQYPFADPAAGQAAGPGTYTDPNYLTALAAGNPFAMASRLSPVEDVMAGGFGTLTAQPDKGQNVQGMGAWSDGKWRVVFSRDLGSTEVEDVRFTPGRLYSIAFAAWDGENDERNGQKSTSQWVSMQLAGNPPAPVIPVGPTPAPKPYDLSPVLFIGLPIGLTVLLIFGLAGGVLLLVMLGRKEQ